MSVFGGDSWAREAQNRKRRVDDLLVECLDPSSYRKLPNGRFTCLVCPNNAVLDSTIMLSMHSKGSRHLKVVSKLKEKELKTQDGINKRIALSVSSYSGAHSLNSRLASGPLIEQTRKAASDILHDGTCQQNSVSENSNVKVNKEDVSQVTANFTQITAVSGSGESAKKLAEQNLDFWERRERELQFAAAGWKRDCHGKWYKDENVEFDSDEEDPNVCLG